MFILSDDLRNIAVHKDLKSFREIACKREFYLSTKEIGVLICIKKKITEKFNDNILLLYGSRARGDANVDSDYDLCVLVPELNKNYQEELFTIIWEEGFENDMFFQTVYFTYDNFFSEDVYKTRHVQSIFKEGIEINGEL